MTHFATWSHLLNEQIFLNVCCEWSWH